MQKKKKKYLGYPVLGYLSYDSATNGVVLAKICVLYSR